MGAGQNLWKAFHNEVSDEIVTGAPQRPPMPVSFTGKGSTMTIHPQHLHAIEDDAPTNRAIGGRPGSCRILRQHWAHGEMTSVARVHVIEGRPWKEALRVGVEDGDDGVSAQRSMSTMYGMLSGPVEEPWIAAMGCCVEPWEWVCGSCGHKW